MYLWLSRRIPDHGPTGGYSIATICRRHHVLLARIDGRGAPRLHHARHILGLLGPAAKQGEVLGRRHRLVFEGISQGLSSAGNTRHLTPHPLPRASSSGGKTSRSQLAADNGEDWGPPWGLAGSASLPQWLLGAVVIRTGSHSHIFFGYIPDVGRGAALNREHHATLLLTGDAAIWDQGGGPGRMEDSLPPKNSWLTQDPTP